MRGTRSGVQRNKAFMIHEHRTIVNNKWRCLMLTMARFGADKGRRMDESFLPDKLGIARIKISSKVRYNLGAKKKSLWTRRNMPKWYILWNRKGKKHIWGFHRYNVSNFHYMERFKDPTRGGLVHEYEEIF